MKSNEGVLINLLSALAVAAAGGAIVLATLFFVAHWTFLQSVFMAAVAFLAAAVFLSWAFVTPLPGPGEVVIRAEKPGPKVRPVPTQHKPAAIAAAAAPVVAQPVPAVSMPVVSAAEVPAKPPVLAAARDGQPDDLKIVRGIGPKLEQMLHGMGIFHFDQIAAWGAAELAWVDDNLEGFKGRASRDAWVPQAKVLAEGGSEAEAFAAADAVKG